MYEIILFVAIVWAVIQIRKWMLLRPMMQSLENKHVVVSKIIIIHNEELNDLYASPNFVGAIKLRRMRWAGHVARMEEWRGVYRVLVGKPEGKRPLERPRRRWNDNIKKDLKQVECGGMDWIELAQDRDRWRALVHALMNHWVPYTLGIY